MGRPIFAPHRHETNTSQLFAVKKSVWQMLRQYLWLLPLFLVLGADTSSCTRLNYLFEDDICGNGIIVSPETCDDGNTQNGDGCSESCLIEVRQDSSEETPDDITELPECPLSEIKCPDGTSVEVDLDTCTFDCREHCYFEIGDTCPDLFGNSEDEAIDINQDGCGDCYGGASSGCDLDVDACNDTRIVNRTGDNCEHQCNKACDIRHPEECPSNERAIERAVLVGGERCYWCEMRPDICPETYLCPDGTEVPVFNSDCDYDCREHCTVELESDSCGDGRYPADINGDGCPECVGEGPCWATNGRFETIGCDEIFVCGEATYRGLTEECSGATYIDCQCPIGQDYDLLLGCTNLGVDCDS